MSQLYKLTSHNSGNFLTTASTKSEAESFKKIWDTFQKEEDSIDYAVITKFNQD